MGFWASCVNDAEKSVSPAHVITIALTVAVIGWVSYLVVATHLMPDLSGCAYLLGGAAGVNVAHKAEDIIAKFKGQPNGQ
jgi:hypothetical protein